jgi:hypothetical protein
MKKKNKKQKQGVARIQEQIVSNFIKTIFVFKMQDQDFKIHSE